MQTGTKSTVSRCDQLLQIRAPSFLKFALDRAADDRLLSRSDYVRTALLDRLRADGVDISQVDRSSVGKD